ncbi:MAG: gliding motility-associated C-terminal domain-containing protein [Crocinitomicaceae bacterium]|nr:gliding motility-associated C-terminal domain-containing protein [Crocinitomicaceae bacterium]
MIQKVFSLFCAILVTHGVLAQADLTINPSITSPTSACYMTSTETITATLVNTSAFPYSGTVEMGYVLDNNPPVTQNQTIGFLPASGTFIYSFPVPDDFSSCDTHYLKIWVYDASDPNNANDTINTYVLSDCDPVTGWITGADTVCMGNNSGEVTLNGYVGNVEQWGVSFDNGSTWSYVANTDTFLVYSNVSQVTTFQAIVGSKFGLCPSDTTGPYNLYLHQLSDGGTLTPDFDICDNGNGGNVWTSGYTGNVLNWMLSTNSGGSWIPLSNSADTISYTNLTATTWWQVIVKNGSCPADTAGPIIATLIPGTAPGTITGPTVVCNFENSDQLVASGGNGTVIGWNVSTDSGATWNPTTDTDSIFDFTGLQTSSWFQAVWQLGSCPIETANHPITVLPVTNNITPDTTIEEGDAINLNACCGNSYLWWPDQFMDDPTSPTPIVDPDADITYFVQITTIEGCKDTARIVVTVNPDLTTLLIPNLFTPNGDGYNDQWEIGNIQAFTNNNLTIFNIYGQVVYDAEPYNNEWEGTYNGKPLPDGTYFYLIRLNDPFYPDPIQGVITIAGND